MNIKIKEKETTNSCWACRNNTSHADWYGCWCQNPLKVQTATQSKGPFFPFLKNLLKR